MSRIFHQHIFARTGKPLYIAFYPPTRPSLHEQIQSTISACNQHILTVIHRYNSPYSFGIVEMFHMISIHNKDTIIRTTEQLIVILVK